jgi:crossover junction endodeoxyribonuclease RusA
MSHVALLRLSWPHPALWQNRRTHWRRRASKTADYRREAWASALAQSVGRLETTTPRLVFSFHPPDRRKRDLHNMPATMKAAIDGIAQAMGCDDEGFRCVWPEAWGDVVKGGCVMIEITEGDIRA